MPTVTKPPILDSTGQAIVTALGNISIRPQIVDNCTTADSTKALSANQGKVLNDYVTSIKPSLGMDNNGSNTLQNTTNANNVDKTSVLYTLGASNLPSGISTYGYLTTLEASHTLKTQTYNPYNSQVTYKRICNDGNWGNWQTQNPRLVRINKEITCPTSFSALSDFVVTIPAMTYFIATARLYYMNSSVANAGIGYYDNSRDYQTNVAFIYPNSGVPYVHYPTITWAQANYDSSPEQICPYGAWEYATTNRIIFEVMLFENWFS